MTTRREYVMPVRVSAGEKAAITAAAERAGTKASTFLRDLGLSASDTEPSPDEQLEQVLSSVRAVQAALRSANHDRSR